MSAPNTDLEQQHRRHRGPIAGIVFGLVFVAFLAVAAFVWPGLPRDEQAAPDGVPTEMRDAEAGAAGAEGR